MVPSRHTGIKGGILWPSFYSEGDSRKYGLNSLPGAGNPPELSLVIAGLNRAEIADACRDPRNKFVAPDIRIRLIGPFDDGQAAPPASPGACWGLMAVGCLDSPCTGEGVTVAILDTGIERRVRVELVEEDLTGEGNGDLNGHGTHCAGTLFGRAVNGLRIGVAPGVQRALILKVLGRSGGGSSEHLVNAIMRAADAGPHVLSMSVGFDYSNTMEHLRHQGYPEPLLFAFAFEGSRANVRLFHGIAQYLSGRHGNRPVVVAAAGNQSLRHLDPRYKVIATPPADTDGFLAVAAVGDSRNPNQHFEVRPFRTPTRRWPPRASASGQRNQAGGWYR